MSAPRSLDSADERIVLAAQAVSRTVRLVGDAGLALLLGHRRSDDLDLFAEKGEDIEPIVRSIEAEAIALGALPTRVRAGPGFMRIELSGKASTARIDVAADTGPRLVAGDTLVGPVRVESLQDQRANKLVALLGRSETRDLIDLLFIERAGLRAIEGLDDAVRKDGGMDPAWLAWATSQTPVRAVAGMIAPLDVEELARFREALRREALDRAGA